MFLENMRFVSKNFESLSMISKANRDFPKQ